jgi:ribosomal protein L18E
MKRPTHSRVRLSFLLVAVLLVVGMAIGVLPAAAVSAAAPYKAEFYADGVLVATVPFDPSVGITAEIEVPAKEGFSGKWEDYSLTESDVTIHAVYTPLAGYRAPLDDTFVIRCLVVLIVILFICILLLVLLTLRARKILRANGLWGKGHGKQDSTSAPAAEMKTDNKEETKEAEDQVAATSGQDPISNEETSDFGKKSEASAAYVAENVEADSSRAPAEACEKQDTASEPAAASTPTPAATEEASGRQGETEQEKTKANKKKPKVMPIPLVVQDDGETKETEEKPVQEQDAPAGVPDDDMATVLMTRDGRRIQMKCRQSFRARIILAGDESKGYYNDLKNYLLSYDGVVASDSLNYESFNGGRRQLAKLNITGKTVVLYLALDPAKLDGSKYKYDNVGDRKRYEKTPVKVKVRSDRSAKWAKELIDMTMAEDGRAFVALKTEVHVSKEKMSREELIRAGLVQIDARDMASGEKVDRETIVALIDDGAVMESDRGENKPTVAAAQEGSSANAVLVVATDDDAPAEEEEEGVGEGFVLADMPMMANIDLAPEDDFIPHVDTVTVEEAAALVKNEVALHHIAHHHVAHAEEALEAELEEEAPVEEAGEDPASKRVKNNKRGKAALINIDKLDRHYAAGESITLSRLKADGLVPTAARKLKILAHGTLSKPLTVEADAFSLTAVKMILLTGGTPVLLD